MSKSTLMVSMPELINRPTDFPKVVEYQLLPMESNAVQQVEKWQAVFIPLAGCRILLVLRRYLQTIAKFEYQASIAVGGDHIQGDCPNVWIELGKGFVPFP